jgi:hypothetical protein
MLDHTSTPPIVDSPMYHNLLVALDASAHTSQCMTMAVELAGLTPGSKITGIHVNPSHLQEERLRSQEETLPDQYQNDDNLFAEQRLAMEDLLTKDKEAIFQSYMSKGTRSCQQVGIAFAGRLMEGKIDRKLAGETRTGEYDLMVIGAQGAAAVPDENVGRV